MLDVAATREKFIRRITDLSTEALARYLPTGCYLSTYDVWGCFEDAPPDTAARSSNAFDILRIARERGLFVRGVVTERKTRGVWINTPEDSSAHRVYCGRSNTFSPALRAHPVLSVQPHDKVYMAR